MRTGVFGTEVAQLWLKCGFPYILNRHLPENATVAIKVYFFNQMAARATLREEILFSPSVSM